MKRWLNSFLRHRTSLQLKADRRVLEPVFSAIYAIGDVHGCIDELLCLEKKILRDAAKISGSKLIVMLGDYIDRGPSSASVIEHLLAPLPPDLSRICLLGNHEQMFLEFWKSPSQKSKWLAFGGDETLASYGVYLEDNQRYPLVSQVRATVPPDHIDFLSHLPVMLRVGDYCFVHAGIDPALSLEEQQDDVLLTSRPHQFNWDNYAGSATVVHGHTPVREVNLATRCVNLDLKVYESGLLAALRISGNGLDVILSS